MWKGQIPVRGNYRMATPRAHQRQPWAAEAPSQNLSFRRAAAAPSPRGGPTVLLKGRRRRRTSRGSSPGRLAPRRRRERICYPPPPCHYSVHGRGEEEEDTARDESPNGFNKIRGKIAPPSPDLLIISTVTDHGDGPFHA